MNRDDIILMAREAGMKACCGRTDKSGKHHPTVNALFSTVPVQWLEQFAKLVASKEREECAITAWSAGMDAHTKASSLADPREIGSICARAIRSRSKT